MKNFYIESMTDGRVRYRMMYKDPLTGKSRRVTATYDHDSVRNRRKAEEELFQKVDSIIKGVDRSNLTFDEVMAYYKAYIQKSLKSTTVRRNSASMDRILRTFPPGTILNNITPAIWKEHLLTLSKNKPGTYNEYVARLKTFLRWCIQNDYVSDMTVIMKVGRLPDISKREKIADKYMEPHEAKTLISAMEGMTQWQLLTEFMVLSGLRIGEVASLTWDDIDKDYIHVTKTCDFIEKKNTTTKTLTSTRDVSIQDELADCIERIREYDKWYTVAKVKTNLVFPDKNGSFLHYDAYNNYLKENAERVLHRRITTHTLRHTHVSLLFAQGFSLDAIARRVGHENSRITKAIYLHLTEKIKQNDAERIKGIKLL